jgi:purine-binding chemotaxis protein CheW
MKTEVVRLVTFLIGDGLFAVDVHSVERVLRHQGASSVTDLPEWIEGVIEYQGQVIPIVDLRRRIEVANPARDPESRVLVLSTRTGWVGAIVDSVLAVAVVPKTDVSPPPPLFRGLSGDFIRGVAKIGEQLAVILHVDHMLTSTDRIVMT